MSGEKSRDGQKRRRETSERAEHLDRLTKLSELEVEK